MLDNLKKRISAAKKILLISHSSPDGDTLGSNLALFHALTSLKKDTSCASIDNIPSCFNFLPGIEKFKKDFNPNEYDLIFVLDCGAHYMTGFHDKYPNIFKRDPRVVNIDHHESNDLFASLNIVFPEACCASVIVMEVLKSLNVEFNSKIATCLLTGVYTDTGSFMHSNANSYTHKAAAFLLRKGGDFRSIAKNIFRTIPIERLKIWGEALKNIKLSDKGFAISGITKEDFSRTGAVPDDLSGVIDFINSIPGTAFSLLLTERGDKVKGSLRTLRDDINLSHLAEKSFGGGGHRKAAGFSVVGKLNKEMRFRIKKEAAKI